MIRDSKQFKGYAIDVLQKIAEIVGFEYTISDMNANSFGFMDENVCPKITASDPTDINFTHLLKGEWNGCIRRLINNEVDMILGSMSVLAERESVVDFTLPIYDMNGILIMMKIPDNKSALFLFLTVMDRKVWFGILGAYLVTRYKCLADVALD